jgi:hypothetical protein
MGCFDYECECGGESCKHVGGQLGEAQVIIEVPLSDGTTVYLEGNYECYGYVVVGNYQFYLKQFEEYFKGWFASYSDSQRKKNFLAGRVWTLRETVWKCDEDGDEYKRRVRRRCFEQENKPIASLSSEILASCIRADTGYDIDSDAQKKRKRISELTQQIVSLQRQLDVLLKEESQ